MDSDHLTLSAEEPAATAGTLEMPEPTAAPLVLALGIGLLAAGIVLGMAMTIVGGALFLIGLGLWVASLLPGKGHFHEPLVNREAQPAPIHGAPGTVERMAEGKPGYRAQLPAMVHPVSAGVKGGILGGLVMPIPALAYSLATGHGVWYPANLLAGMALPGLQDLSLSELEQFHASYLIAAVFIHAVMSLVVGLAYGVLLPTLPKIPKELAWGALLMPVLWTGISFAAISVMNPDFYRRLDWPSFVFAQFVFGVAAALTVRRMRPRGGFVAGLSAGIVGGACMAIPAAAWGWLTGHAFWYPVNLLAAMITPRIAELPTADLEKFHGDWLLVAVGMHAVLSLAFGVALGLVSPKLPDIPAAISWGALLMPVLWTALSYSVMDVVSPVLARRVDWPWFVASQFVFGLTAAVVVARSEKIILPPAGRGVAAV
jgi:hypothetical protein